MLCRRETMAEEINFICVFGFSLRYDPPPQIHRFPLRSAGCIRRTPSVGLRPPPPPMVEAEKNEARRRRMVGASPKNISSTLRSSETMIAVPSRPSAGWNRWVKKDPFLTYAPLGDPSCANMKHKPAASMKRPLCGHGERTGK